MFLKIIFSIGYDFWYRISSPGWDCFIYFIKLPGEKILYKGALLYDTGTKLSNLPSWSMTSEHHFCSF